MCPVCTRLVEIHPDPRDPGNRERDWIEIHFLRTGQSCPATHKTMNQIKEQR